MSNRPSSPVYKQRRGQESREALLNAATELFSGNGFEATSLRRIASDAGVSFQVIAYHFGSKLELWLAVVNRLWDAAFVNLGRAAVRGPDDDPRRALLRSIHSGLTWNSREPHLRRIFTHEFLSRSDRYHEFLLPKLREFVRLAQYRVSAVTEKAGITELTTTEILLLYRSFLVCNALTPDEFEMTSGLDSASDEFIQMELNLLSRLIFGSAPADSDFI